jgi:hypothetical protein
VNVHSASEAFGTLPAATAIRTTMTTWHFASLGLRFQPLAHLDQPIPPLPVVLQMLEHSLDLRI